MNNGHIRKRKTKKGTTWQVVVELGENATTGKRNRLYKNARTEREAKSLLVKLLNELETGSYVKEEKISIVIVSENRRKDEPDFNWCTCWAGSERLVG